VKYFVTSESDGGTEMTMAVVPSSLRFTYK